MLINKVEEDLNIIYPANYTELDIQNLITEINTITVDFIPRKIILLNKILSLNLILYIFEKFGQECEIVLEEEPYNLLQTKKDIILQKYNNINITLNKG